jgi:PAT family beta-lactamase induction signal transducer AmpG
LMAILTLVTTIPVLAIREPPAPTVAGEELGAAQARRRPLALLRPIWSFVRRPQGARLVAILVVYKLGDALAVGMMKPFFVDRGYSDTWIAVVRGTLGGAAAALGALAAGLLLDRIGRRRAMIFFPIVHALAILAYAIVAARGASESVFVVLVVAEHLAGSASTGALFAWMMDHCRDDHRASDYTVQSCIVAVTTGVGLAASGVVAGRFGYVAHFVFTGMVALAAPVAVKRWWVERSSSRTE